MPAEVFHTRLMKRNIRRLIALICGAGVILAAVLSTVPEEPVAPEIIVASPEGSALTILQELPVKGKAPKTGYAREQFGNGWSSVDGCDTRNIILYRDLVEVTLESECQVQTGVLQDPYTNTRITFTRNDSSAVQIDHVVALSDAWQKGAQQLTKDQRVQLANDPLELLAVDGPANMQKSDADAASWLPDNKQYRCAYIARQIAVKKKYMLWVTQPEKDAMTNILSHCPAEPLPVK